MILITITTLTTTITTITTTKRFVKRNNSGTRMGCRLLQCTSLSIRCIGTLHCMTHTDVGLLHVHASDPNDGPAILLQAQVDVCKPEYLNY